MAAGEASISQSGKQLDVQQSSHRAVIDWRSFDIAPDEHTRFYQPSSTAIALNRVKSANPSSILGRLSANGNIILSNPSGVFFGPGSVVDVNGLVATSANIGNDDFMAGSNVFNIPGNPDAAIVNEGVITAKEAGLVGLIAPSVVNSGVISARLGRVQLAAGETATLDFYGDGLLKVALEDAQVTSQLVANSGVLHAPGGEVLLSAAKAGHIVNSLVTAEGELHAPTVEQKQGKIVIKSGAEDGAVMVRGLLNASGRDIGEQGGQINVLGDHVAVLDGTVNDASGHSAPTASDAAAGGTASLTADGNVRSEEDFLAYKNRAGGSIKIGGDYLGQGETQTSKTLYVGENTLTLNDALQSGDGGRTIFWSDGTTDFNGTVFAKGGANGGNGGFLETSGKINLSANGFADLSPRASGFDKGTYLLDPADITVFGNETSAFTDASLHGYWDFEGDADDSTSNGNNGTINGAIFTGTGAPTPQHNTNSLSFDGSNDYVETGIDTTISGSQPWTISYWANIDSSESGGSRQAWPIWKGPSGQSADRLIGVSVTSGNVEVAHWGNDVTYTAPIDFDSWQNVVVTYDGVTNQSIYLNGLIADSRNNVGTLAVNGDEWFFGGRPGREFTRGLIDDVRVYNSVLSTDKIAEINGTRFTVAGLEHMSQTANIDLQATNSITLDLQGDTLDVANNNSISLTTTGAGSTISDVSAGTIQTDIGNITLDASGAGSNININQTNLEATNGGEVRLSATGSVNLEQASTLSLGTVSGDTVLLRTTNAASDITLNNTVTATGAGNALTLAAGRHFINNHGTGTLTASGGRFLVYSTDPAENTLGGQTFNFQRFNSTYTGNPPASITAAGNGFLYTTGNPTPDLPSTFEQRRDGVGLNMIEEPQNQITLTDSGRTESGPTLAGEDSADGEAQQEEPEDGVYISDLNIRISERVAQLMDWTDSDIRNLFGVRRN